MHTLYCPLTTGVHGAACKQHVVGKPSGGKVTTTQSGGASGGGAGAGAGAQSQPPEADPVPIPANVSEFSFTNLFTFDALEASDRAPQAVPSPPSIASGSASANSNQGQPKRQRTTDLHGTTGLNGAVAQLRQLLAQFEELAALGVPQQLRDLGHMAAFKVLRARELALGLADRTDSDTWNDSDNSFASCCAAIDRGLRDIAGGSSSNGDTIQAVRCLTLAASAMNGALALGLLAGGSSSAPLNNDVTDRDDSYSIGSRSTSDSDTDISGAAATASQPYAAPADEYEGSPPPGSPTPMAPTPAVPPPDLHCGDTGDDSADDAAELWSAPTATRSEDSRGFYNSADRNNSYESDSGNNEAAADDDLSMRSTSSSGYDSGDMSTSVDDDEHEARTSAVSGDAAQLEVHDYKPGE